MSTLWSAALSKPLINATHSSDVERPHAREPVFFVRSKVEALERFSSRYPLRTNPRDLIDHIGEVALQRRDMRFVAEWPPVPRQADSPIHLFARLERLPPFVEVTVAHVRNATLDQIA